MLKTELKTEKVVAQADKLRSEAVRLHAFYRGKVEVMPKCPIQSPEDLGIWYTEVDPVL